ncbi:TonB-dependent receptor [Sphingobium sp. H39-3-25]|uniref:TonB-dependent receptor domain-containing protein n=1 Tax=Sphingobium arseniciresistens TaxID=3030834 RepID=UPI0023BA2060|nr:TonB-dependent receptor [Sphingobium arseniciresistens]
MKKCSLLFTVASFAIISPAMAEAPPAAAPPEAGADGSASSGPAKEVFSTGVAKGRDRLDSAISTSSLKESEIEKLGARSLGEIFRNIPGIRAEASNGEGNNSYSIRGLPLASTGSKYLQFQEDGLPVLEFGDMFVSADAFMRADLTLSQIEAIRGGSASTFASNSPGGVINLISKTGEVEGGTVQLSSGINYDEKRADFDYGGKISDTLRYNIGGFYRTGEGPREIGYTGYKGGQVKLNVTKTFDGGYVRISGKYLDDRAPAYQPSTMRVTGTNANPDYQNIEGYNISKDAPQSAYVTNIVTLDGNNQLYRDDLREGMHPIVKSIGLDTQFDLSGWTISEKFRFADISGQITQFQPVFTTTAPTMAGMFGGAGATLRYASGPNLGQLIASPATLNGNGLLTMALLRDTKINSLDTMTNDLRATRQWNIGGGVLTLTGGYYRSSQTLDTDWLFTTAIADVRGGGEAALVNITTAAGVPQTQNGILAYSSQLGSGSTRRKYDVEFDVNAPYGSVNYHIGKVAIGGSLRYDTGKARGWLYGSDLGGGRGGITSYDMNGDGVISAPERSTAILPLTNPAPIDFGYHYLSYSTGINYRVAEPFAVFARYSRGGRGAADRFLFTPVVSPLTGKLVDPRAGHDTVKQAEIGAKFRQSDVSLNVTGFWAETSELNLQTVSRADGTLGLDIIARTYRAYGAELEGGIRRGPFSLTAGATLTHAEIAQDSLNPVLEGNVPRHQAKLIFQATPQFEVEQFTAGFNVVGTTSSYTQDTNQLKLPAFTTVGAFLQYRPVSRVELSMNVNNLFDVTGLTDVAQPAIPASGFVSARAINGRTISTSLRFTF